MATSAAGRPAHRLWRADRPLASWITWLASVRQDAGSTFQPVAAACTSIALVPAPTLRSGVQKARIELELPVTCWWKIGLP